jgi:hypothetical protein
MVDSPDIGKNAAASIFISYAREDRDQARALAALFEQCGWTVWWDHKIPIGLSFDEAIELALGSARCVVVLWTAQSVGSAWVKNEAQVALDRGTLVPVALDGSLPPLAFRGLETAQMSGWDGERGHPELERLLEHVAARLADAAGRDPPPPAPRRSRLAAHAPHIVVAVACGALFFGLLRFTEHIPPAPPAWLFDELVPAVLELYRTADDLDTAAGHYLAWRPSTAEVFKTQLRDLGAAVARYNQARSRFEARSVGFRRRLSGLHSDRDALFDAALNLIAHASDFKSSYDPPRFESEAGIDEQRDALMATWQQEKTSLKGRFSGIQEELAHMERELLVSTGRDVPTCGN